MKKSVKNKSRKNITRKVLGKIARKNKKKLLNTLKRIKASLKQRRKQTRRALKKKMKGGKSIPFSEVSTVGEMVGHNVSQMGSVFKDTPLPPPNSLSTHGLSPSVVVNNTSTQ